MDPFNHQGGHSIKIGDASIYVEEKGPKNAFPIVFLHGGLGTIEDFGPLIEKMNGDFRVIGIDSRGHGKSTLGAEALSYERLEKDVEIVLENLSISRCCLLGFSDGGIISYRLAINKPQLVSGIVTIGADWNPPGPEVEKRFSAVTKELWEKKFPMSVELYNQLNPGADFARLIKKVVAMWLDRGPFGYPKDRLKEICSDALIIRGDEDHLMPRSSITHLNACLPMAKVFNIPFAGHAAHEEQSEAVSIIVNQFISRLIMSNVN